MIKQSFSIFLIFIYLFKAFMDTIVRIFNRAIVSVKKRTYDGKWFLDESLLTFARYSLKSKFSVRRDLIPE